MMKHNHKAKVMLKEMRRGDSTLASAFKARTLRTRPVRRIKFKAGYGY